MTTFDEARERAFLEDNIGTFRRHTGRSLKGFFGPSASSTERTPDLLAEYGFLYYCDFMHDDQPMPLRVKSGRLISMPYTMDINDGALLRTYGDSDYFVQVCKAQFDQLYEESGESGRVMCLAFIRAGPVNRIVYALWVACSTTYCDTMGCGRRPPTRSLNIFSPITMMSSPNTLPDLMRLRGWLMAPKRDSAWTMRTIDGRRSSTASH